MGDRGEGAQQGSLHGGRPALQPIGFGGGFLRPYPLRFGHCFPWRCDQLPADERQDPPRVRAQLHRLHVHRAGRFCVRRRHILGLQPRKAHLRQGKLGLRARRRRLRQDRPDPAAPPLRLPMAQAPLRQLYA